MKRVRKQETVVRQWICKYLDLLTPWAATYFLRQRLFDGLISNCFVFLDCLSLLYFGSILLRNRKGFFKVSEFLLLFVCLMNFSIPFYVLSLSTGLSLLRDFSLFPKSFNSKACLAYLNLFLGVNNDPFGVLIFYVFCFLLFESQSLHRIPLNSF